MQITEHPRPRGRTPGVVSGDLVGGLLGGQRAGVAGAEAPAPSGMTAMLDMNGDGDPLDDILRMAGKEFR
jgi:hypothetical protein